MNLKRLVFAGSLAAACASCAPQRGMYKYVPGTDLVFTSKETLADIGYWKQELDQRSKISELKARVTTEKGRKKLDQIIAFMDILDEVRKPPLDPAAQKAVIRNSIVHINGGSGVLLSSDGYFITVAHAIPDSGSFIVEYQSEEYSASWIGKMPAYDLALGKIDFGEQGETRLVPIRFADMLRVKEGQQVEVIGQISGNYYFQVGTIKSLDEDVPVRSMDHDFLMRASMHITAYSKSGFSGGPVVLADTGELVGLDAYSSTNNTTGNFVHMGAARIDSAVRMIIEIIGIRIKEIEKEIKLSTDAKSNPD